MLATTEEQYTPLHYAACYIPPYEVEFVDGPALESQEIRDHLTSSKKTMEYLSGTAEMNVRY